MDIKDFLSHLTVSHGPSESGEYMCRCPVHDDRTASLSVGTGKDGRILLKCMAGCSTQDVVKALGLKMADLFPEGSRPPRTDAAKPTATKAPAAKAAAGKAPLGELTKIYPYTDEDGRTLFEVCRFERVENGQRVKTFRQRRLDPGNPKAKAGGYVWNISGVRSVIYRLPEVKAAIAAGKTVYLVEGEKDADTLAAAGYCATTNPGGASKQGSPKWLPEHTQLLTGARVVILPDNDAAGINDRTQVAKSLAVVCESVKLLDLRKACPGLPAKGDITDMLSMMGNVEGFRALAALEAATDPLDTSAAQAVAARDAAAALINNVPGYCVDDGCICTWNEEAPKRLCRFTAIVSGVVTRDDGVNSETYLMIDGWTKDGRALPQARVTAEAYRNMGWVGKKWDVQGNIMPGTAVADKLRYIISEAGVDTVQYVREYAHTGWRKIDGKWCYLYSGGAIGAENVRVSFEENFDNYCLDARFPKSGRSESDLADVTLLTLYFPRRISVPLIGFMFLAPLNEALTQAGHPPLFSVYLVGGTGTGKTTLSALIMNFFGVFSESTLPANFTQTANSIRRKAFLLKDMVLGIDDYHPQTDLKTRKEMEKIAQQLARAFGDRASRDRLNTDRTLSGSMPPRSLALISGEDMPDIGQSGQARYYVIQVSGHDIKRGEELLTMQDMAADGVFAHMMRLYIEWLIPQMDELPSSLATRFRELRTRFQGIGHSRAAGTIAHLVIGYEMYLRFLTETGVLPDPDGTLMQEELARAVQDIVANSMIQAREGREDRPSRMFLNSIGQLLLARECFVQDLTDVESRPASKGHIGYMDAQYYYLIPDASYTAVCVQFTKQGHSFSLSSRMLYKQLVEDKLIIPDEKGGKTTRVKTIDGKSVRLLWIPRAGIDGPKLAAEQMRIQVPDKDGMKEVDADDTDIPF